MIEMQGKEEFASERISQLPLIKQCIESGWDNYTKLYSPDLRARHSARTRASLINDEIVLEAEVLFANVPGIRFEKRGNAFFAYVGQRMVIRFKKFGPNLSVSGIPTQQHLSLINQQFTLPDFGEMMTIHAGYKLNTLETALEGTYVVCPRGHGKHWFLNLKDIEDRNSVPNIVQLPIQPQKQVAGFTPKLVPKIDKEAEGGSV